MRMVNSCRMAQPVIDTGHDDHYRVGDDVIVKLEWAPLLYGIPGSTSPVAVVMPRHFVPPLRQLGSVGDRYLRYVNPGRGPLYLPGVVLCARPDKDLLIVRKPVLATQDVPYHMLTVEQTASEPVSQRVIPNRARWSYCVHVPAVAAEHSLDGMAKHALQHSSQDEHCPTSLRCTVHEGQEAYYCEECTTPPSLFGTARCATRADMLRMGYICTLRAVDPQ